MAEYRKTLTLDTDRKYHYVNMGRLDFANGPGRYAFPSIVAAERFAQVHKALSPARDITIG